MPRIGLTTRQQGDIGELSALVWLGEQGAKVSIPLGHGPDYDLIADFDGRLHRVQVKTTTVFRDGRWEVAIATRGGNQSWSGLVKRFGAERCDYLFVLAGDGRRWFIPAGQVEATSAMRLDGPKYAAFEVDQGPPIPGPKAGSSLN